MTQRMHVRAMLARYAARFPDEVEVVARIRALVDARADCLSRACFEPGHLTASTWILSLDGRHCLLTHHRKLDRWLQLGGHADGDPHLEQVALREAREESGFAEFMLPPYRGELVPLDLDVHLIPARAAEPEHEHHDVRFLLIADSAQPIVVSEESHDVRWVPVERLAEFTAEDSVLRLQRKVDAMYRAR